MKELRSKVGLVFQYRSISCLKLMFFRCLLWAEESGGLSRKRYRARAMEALELVGIGRRVL